MRLSDRLLRKNMSPARLIGFLLSNFIGLAIVITGLQFFLDSRSIWEDEDSFIKKDYLVVNKRISAENTLGASAGLSPALRSDIAAQPWVRKVGEFTSADFRVAASINQAGRSLSTFMFLESIPDEFIDAAGSSWRYTPGSDVVPIIISKDYLTLYNFGFASSAGMPQLSEGLMSSIPMSLTLSSDDGSRTKTYQARITGYSNRLNTILVPQNFMQAANDSLGTGASRNPSRLIIDVSSPGDVAIQQYLDANGLEQAGDKSGSRGAFLLKIVTGIVLAIGVVITLLSLFILLLSISLLMEKNREKLHLLIMLGYPLRDIARPYNVIIVGISGAALLLSFVAALCLRHYYIGALRGLGDGGATIWPAILTGLGLTLLTVVFNITAVRRKVTASFRL